MDYEDFLEKEAYLLSLYSRAREGDADAVNEMYQMLQRALVLQYKGLLEIKDPKEQAKGRQLQVTS